MSHDNTPTLSCTAVEFTYAIARKSVYDHVIQNRLLYQLTAFDKDDKTGKENEIEEIPDSSPTLDS